MSSLGSKRGFVLIATGACCIVLLGMLGLSVDLGRVYITKNEAQAFTDSAAVLAARELNGKTTGFNNANSAVANSSNGWNFGTTVFTPSNVTVKFGQSKYGPWIASPANATDYGFVEVTATPSLPILFLRLVGTGSTQNVPARSVAGLVPATFPEGGYLPFTPFAHDPNDTTHFGFTVGQEYAFMWPGNVNKAQKACQGDRVNWPQHNMSKQVDGDVRGYFVLNAASSIDATILGLRQELAVNTGDVVPLTSGTMTSVRQALELRASLDSDTQGHNPNNGSPPNYYGNGMRMVFMPVSEFVGNDNVSQAKVLGFLPFLIPMSLPSNATEPWCAIYAGSYSRGSRETGPFAAGAYVTKLLQ